LDGRIDEIHAMLETYGKESHREALHSAHTWRTNVSVIREKYPLETRVFQASATDREEILKHVEPASVDLVFTDIPYGQHARWQTVDGNAPANPLRSMLDALLGIASASSIVAIAADKQQKVLHEGYQRLEQISVGKRRVVILRPA
jgi:hypothetical protein